MRSRPTAASSARSEPSAGRSAPCLAALGTVVPEHPVSREQVTRLAAVLFGGLLDGETRRLLDVFEHSGVDRRWVCMPLEWYERPHALAETSALYARHGLELTTQAARKALAAGGIAPREVDHVILVSSTGIAAPTLDARLANVLGLRSDVGRTPVWGLGCAGGVAGMARARDLARADPRARVLLIALELCSLTFQRGDVDRRNLVASSLFSDGAAAALVVGAEAGLAGSDREAAPPLELVASRSILWPDTLDVMGWTVDELGLHVVFSRDIPALVRKRVRPEVDAFLASQGMTLLDLGHVVAHPGGPRVLAELSTALGIALDRFDHAREVLRRCGNMSSPTCLFVLERALEAGELRPGDSALMLALGPGFALEQLLLRAGRR